MLARAVLPILRYRAKPGELRAVLPLVVDPIAVPGVGLAVLAAVVTILRALPVLVDPKDCRIGTVPGERAAVVDPIALRAALAAVLVEH